MNIAILQARMSSTRLPNKVLKQIKNISLLEYECERLLISKKIHKLIIATSNDKTDDPIEEFGRNKNIQVFRGALNDVLSRYYHCAKNELMNLESENLNIIRVTGDCPFIDPNVIDSIVDYFECSDYDYVSNTLEPTYPDGLDTEVFTFDALKEAYENATYESDREHVTLFIKNSARFKKYNFQSKYDFSNLRLTVDDDKDFELIKQIIENINQNIVNANYMEIISFLTRNPRLLFINNETIRDEGLLKSLKEDGRM